MLHLLLPFLAAFPDPSGHWTGVARVADQETPLRLVVEAESERVVFDAPDLGALGLVVPEVRLDGDRLSLAFPSDRGRNRMELELVDEGLRGTWTLAGDAAVATVELASVAPWPSFRAEEAVFDGDGVRLAGAFVFPEGEGPFPTIVHVHGSGNETRLASRLVAHRLAEHGIASLHYDKRGTGGSTGDWTAVGFEALAKDIVQAVERAAQHPLVDAERIGLRAVSQGGWTAPLAATLSERIAFLIIVSGPLVSPAIEGHWDSLFPLRNAGYGDDVIETVEEILEIWDEGLRTQDFSLYTEALELVRGEPWFATAGFPGPFTGERSEWYRRIFDFDPVPLFESLDVPVLSLLGERDESIPAVESAAILERIAREHAKPFEVVLVPGADHGLRMERDPEAGFRWPAHAEGVFERQAAFVLERVGE